MRFKFGLAVIVFSVFFLSLPAHGDDCSDALMAESCACRSGTADTSKNGEQADSRARSKAAAIRRLAKAAAARDSKGIGGQ